MRTRMPPVARFSLLVAITTASATVIAPSLHPLLAQGGRGGGMGGMGGGMGRGGGRNGGGMNRGSNGGGNGERSGSAGVKASLKHDDEIAFILDHKKPISITNEQADTLKAYRKEMLFMQEPLFKDIDKLLAGSPRGGGDRSGGSAGTRRGGNGGEGGPPAGGSADTVRALISRLNDIQDAYRDRARAKLNAPQLHLADSLQTAWLAEERDKQAKQSPQRTRR